MLVAEPEKGLGNADVVVEVAITKVHVPAVVLTVLTATPVPACGYCVYYLILN